MLRDSVQTETKKSSPVQPSHAQRDCLTIALEGSETNLCRRAASMPSMSRDNLSSVAAGGPGVMRQNFVGVGTNKRQRFEGGQTKHKHREKLGDQKRQTKGKTFLIFMSVVMFCLLFIFFISEFVFFRFPGVLCFAYIRARQWWRE